MTTKTPDKVKPKDTSHLQERDLGAVLLRDPLKRCISLGSVSIFGSLVLSLLLSIPAVAHAACSWQGPYTIVPPPLITSTTGAAINQAQFDALAPVPDVITDCGNYIEKVATSYSLGTTAITPGTIMYQFSNMSYNSKLYNSIADIIALIPTDGWPGSTVPGTVTYFGIGDLIYSNATGLTNGFYSQPNRDTMTGVRTGPAVIIDEVWSPPSSMWPSGAWYYFSQGLVYEVAAAATYQLVTTTTTTYSVTASYTLSLNNLKSKVEPSGTAAGDINSFSGATVLVVNTQTGQPYAGAKVRIKAGVSAHTGGHDHDDAQRPKGTLSSLTDCTEDGVVDTIVCTTQANGNADFTFFAPEASGTHTITATCESPTCIAPASGDINVQVDGLEPMSSSNSYVFVGAVPGFHTDNHNLVPKAMTVAHKLAILYQEKFPSAPLLHYNDASLHFGGVLDICTGKESTPGCSSQCQLQPNGISYTCSWSEPHQEHRRGSVVDVRANNDVQTAIPAANFQDFKKIARSLGADPGKRPHSPNSPTNRHWHVRLLGVAE